jgi:hypothetical protein
MTYIIFLFCGFLSQRLGFKARLVPVGLVVGSIILGQIFFLRISVFSCNLRLYQ